MSTAHPRCPGPESAADPAFLRALDAGAIAALVQQHLAGANRVAALVPDYLRWKEADGSLVGYRAQVQTPGGTVDSYVTVRTEAPQRLAAEVARLANRAGEQWGGLSALALLPDANLLLLAFPIDRAIHDLRKLVQPSKLRSLVMAACPTVVPAGLRLSKSRSSFRLVRYKPERRAVLQWRLGCVDAAGNTEALPAVWVRCHAAGSAANAVAAARAASAAGISCPPTLAVVHDRLTIEGHVEGQSWSPESRQGHDESLDAAAHTVARLHACAPPRGLPLHGPVQELDRALRAAEDLGRLSAALGTTARMLAYRLAAQVPGAGTPGFAHGDLHAGQVLLRADGAALCDFDRAAVAPAAFDLASFHAHCLLADALRGH